MRNPAEPKPPRAKPLKRPSQARAKFTMQAIYGAFVRLWRDKGWTGVTTRAVALETGISVGTLYDYFPNKQALLSGYVRHCIDALLERMEQDVVQATGLSWQQRVQRLVHLTCAVEIAGLPFYDHDMLMLESQIAEPKHHRRVYEELAAKWHDTFSACSDLPCKPEAHTVETLLLAAWGGRRYLLLVQPPGIGADQWVADMERICCTALATPEQKRC